MAVVGLPCHIEAFRKYAIKYNLNNITVVISLFCTIGRMRVGCERFFKEKFNIDINTLNVYKYLSRFGKERPGKMSIETSKGRFLYSYEEYLRYVDYFYTPVGCFSCRKMFGLNADLSIGDAWHIKTSKKIALVIANSRRGLEILERAKFKKILILKRVSESDVIYHLSKSKYYVGKIYKPQEAMRVLYLAKLAGLMFKKLRFPKIIQRIVIWLVLRYITNRAYRISKLY